MDKKQPAPLKRPIMGGTKNGIRPKRYSYWRTGYAGNIPTTLQFWVTQAGEYHTDHKFFSDESEYASWHQFYYQQSGEGFLTTNDETSSILPGHLIIIPKGTIFTFHASDGIQIHWFAIEGECPLIETKQTASVYPLAPHQHIHSIFARLRETLLQEQPGNAFRAVALVYELFATLEAISSNKQSESIYPETLRIALTFLNENYEQPYSSERLATHCRVSTPHLRSLFQKWVGESPHRTHQRYRIEKAERLLLSQDLSVREVAKQVGYSDPYYFSRVFKKMTGVSPSHYRATMTDQKIS